MKQRNETAVESVFNVESIVSVFHNAPVIVKKESARRDHSVMYDFWQLFYVEKGVYKVQMEDCPMHSMEQGQLLLCEPGKLRTSHIGSDARVGIINVRCNSPKMRRLRNRVITLTEQEKAEMLSLLQEGVAMFRNLPESAPYTGQHVVDGTTKYQLQVFKNRIEILLVGFYVRRVKEEEVSPSIQNQLNYYEQKFRMIEEYMKEHLGETLTIEDVCEYTGFSVNTVKRIFRQQVDCGAIHYFLKLKIKEAKRLLGETDLTVTQISDRLGFSGVHYFSKTFKRFVGVSPREYAYSLTGV